MRRKEENPLDDELMTSNVQAKFILNSNVDSRYIRIKTKKFSYVLCHHHTCSEVKNFRQKFLHVFPTREWVVSEVWIGRDELEDNDVGDPLAPLVANDAGLERVVTGLDVVNTHTIARAEVHNVRHFLVRLAGVGLERQKVSKLHHRVSISTFLANRNFCTSRIFCRGWFDAMSALKVSIFHTQGFLSEKMSRTTNSKCNG